MKIKLKVKHLITIIVSMVLLVPLFTFIINPQLNFYLAKKGLDKGNVAAKTKVLEGLETDRLGDFQKWETIQRYMLEGLGKGNYDILIGPTFTQYSQDSDMPFTLDEKLPYIKKYIEEGPVDRYLLTATRQLVSYYLANGNIEKADEVMFRAIERAKKSYMYEEFQMEQAQMKINQKKFAEAADLLEQFSERNLNNDYFGVQIAQKQAELLLREGKLKEAYNKVQQTLRQYEEKVERGDSNISSANSYVYEHLTNMEKGLQKVVSSGEKALRTIHGKLVRSDGTPLRNVGVFLQDANAVNLGVREFEPYYHITNKNGEFRFDGVIPGSYQIILALAFDQIDGWTWPVNMDDWIDVTENTDITYNITLEKLIDIQSPVNQEEITDKSIHFSWDKVEGAAYYELSLGIDVDGDR
ncbi:carboxypeptidase-like regulatory domain-containing protein [Paracerasibacillus soli]|uniref:Carboxypeptidase-like regulatory domain-containing protein n=1 Tax=Paracerasibacillus soli TaxID=480284 RepID=A0ABU5CV80_9BACI|nr:carboxypeptidase-like regulatory domain-containing protein [Virgibacillus soli]MDY0410283.1 carboxypeptidase-like regulatory domain-containing protein [Virgibacillus soli]